MKDSALRLPDKERGWFGVSARRQASRWHNWPSDRRQKVGAKCAVAFVGGLGAILMASLMYTVGYRPFFYGPLVAGAMAVAGVPVIMAWLRHSVVWGVLAFLLVPYMTLLVIDWHPIISYNF